MRSVNAQYNIARPDSIPIRVATAVRRKMFERFIQLTRVLETETVLDVGATSDQTYESSNYLEKWLPRKDRIIALGLDDAGHLRKECPGVRVIRADGMALPLKQASVDVVHCSAVIEHVGDERRQQALIEELCRVARRAVFLTTPNRWYPIEFHTTLPLIHWLPKPVHRKVLAKIGLRELAEESNLNLLDNETLCRLAKAVPSYHTEVSTVTLLGLPSNLMLVMKRREG
jgi:ubiquinone/menaquinone biosynthesis C-methylase UbiE